MINIPGNAPINVRLNKNNQVIVDVAILIDYGLNVTTTTTALQNKIIQSCFEMTGIKNIKVNIEIKGINFYYSFILIYKYGKIIIDILEGRFEWRNIEKN